MADPSLSTLEEHPTGSPVVGEETARSSIDWRASLPVFVALLIGFSLPFTRLSRLPFVAHVSSDPYTVWGAANVIGQVLVVTAITLIVVGWERMPLSSIGLLRPTWSDLALAVGTFSAVGLAGIVSEILVLRALGVNGRPWAAQMAELMKVPMWLSLAAAVGNGIAEEVVARGYAIERLRSLTGSVFLASAAAYIADLAMHIPFWGWSYPLAIALPELVFVLVFLWTRRLVPCIIGHFLSDAGPFALVAAATIVPALLAGGDFHLNRGYLMSNRGDYRGAIVEFSRVLRRDPKNVEAYKGRAMALWYEDDFDAAIDDLTKAIRQSPNDSDAYGNRALAYYSKRDYGRMQSDLRRSLILEPSQSYAYSLRAYLEVDASETDQALADLDQAINHSRRDNELYERRAYVHALKREHEREIADWNEALRIKPENAAYHDSRARVYLLVGDFKHAIDDYRAEIRIDPQNSEACNALAWILSTSPDANVRDGREAIDLASHASVLTNMESPNFIDTLAAAYAEAGDFDQAVTFERRAIGILERPCDSALLDKMEGRLSLYRRHKPYREDPRLVAQSGNH